ncbi:MAG: hypothetical protein ACJAVZ_000427 [Afipia broomeae]|jgi:hypothetical protein|nr:MAG: hypothetical protein EKK35_06365 [Bradyrhizobiaceae bacterium]
MSYALFVDDVQVSRALPTQNDVWHYADDAGLVVDALIQDETGKPERVLEQGYSIRQADPDHADPDQAEPDEAKPLPGLEKPKRVA